MTTPNKDRLTALTEEIVALVPEIMTGFEFLSGESRIIHAKGVIDLETCIAALYRHFAKQHNLMAFTTAQTELVNVWYMMKPFESQTDAHILLSNYLLK